MMQTCLIGAIVDVLPDPDVKLSESGVGETVQRRYRGRIVNVFQMPPHPGMPHFWAPHYSVLVDKEIWPVIPACRIEVISIPALEPDFALAPT